MVKGYKRRRGAAGITAAEPKRVSGGGAVPPRSRVKLCVCRFVESGDVRPYSAERRRGPRKSASKASGFWGNRSDADLYILYGRTSHGQKVFERYGKVISKVCKKLLWFVVLSPGIFLRRHRVKFVWSRTKINHEKGKNLHFKARVLA